MLTTISLIRPKTVLKTITNTNAKYILNTFSSTANYINYSIVVRLFI